MYRSLATTLKALPIMLLLLTTLAACGAPSGSSAAPAADAPLDACALLSADEATAALGMPLQPARHGDLEHAGDGETASVSTCRFAARDTASGVGATLMVRRSPGDENSPAAIAAVRETARELGQQEPQDISGLGDTAFWSGRQLHVFRGGRLYLLITVSGAEGPAALALAQRLAQTAIGRL